MASATIRLGELISTNNRGNTCPQYTPTLLDKIDKLLDEGADINIVVCVYRGSNDLVYRLLGSNPKIDSTFRPLSNGWTAADDASNFLHLLFLAVIATPLIDAADQDDREAMSFLARRGARIEPILESLSASLIRTDRLWDPFFLPGKDDRYKSIQRILNLADPAHKIVQGWVWAAFHNVATSGGDENLALMLLRHGAQPTDGELGSTALQALIDIACRHQIQPATISTSSPEFISVVFLDNMDLCALVPRDSSYQTARGPCGITPLILSAGSASVAMCEFLLNCGANPNEFDDFGMTALMDAIYFGHEEAVSLLLARGAETKRTESGSIKSSLPASRFLPAGNDDQWNERVKYAGMCKQRGWHALHLAAHQGRLVALRALCNVSASIATPDDDGNFPLDIALLNSQDMAAYFLLERKCPFDTRSQAASRLLTQAITDCKHSIVTQLLESGVLPSPCFHFSEEYTKRDNSSKTKEHLGKSLPLRASKMSPLKDYGNAPVDLCLDCFTRFKTAKFSPASKSDPNCKSCRLLADCARDSPDQLPKLLYSMKDGAKDDELVTMSSKLIFRHPIKEVQDDWHMIFERIKHCDDADTSSSAASIMASSWLRRCIDGHHQCNINSASEYFPTRVIDLEGVNSGMPPRLLQNTTLCKPYLALSHRWGFQGLPVTTRENLASRLEGINMDELSQIMRDAIRIVLDLGYRYLWIDALCIIQDSTDDWLSEASKMSSVFSGAVVTIAVADAENQSDGIFRKRPAQCMRPFYVPWLKAIPHRNRMHIDNEAKYYVFPRSDLVGGGTRTKGTLDTRGWVLQEQLLSRRILYYDKGEIYWDCITLSASESSPISASLLEVTNPDEIWAQKLIRRTVAGAVNGETLRARISDAWLEIIKNYSGRILTNQSDRLIALKGIIEPLKMILGEDQVAGMWREDLWRQLTWWTHAPSSSEGITKGFLAPSWSWLSVRDRVYYHNSLLGDNPGKDAVSHKFTELRPFYFMIENIQSEQLPGTMGIIGTMTITAKCFPYRLTDKDLKKILYKRWNRAVLKLNTGRWMLDAPQKLPIDIHCIIVAEDTVAKMLVSLCIVPDKQQDGIWRRVGLCHWDGLAWQIPSFVGIEPETRTFTVI